VQNIVQYLPFLCWIECVKIATWNVNSLKVRLEQVLQWLVDHKPDVMALQETKVTDENFPLEAIRQVGYQAVYSGQKTYNGVAILSKLPATKVISDFPTFGDQQRRVLAATIKNVRVLNLYVPNGGTVESDKYLYKLDWLTHLNRYVQQQLTQYQKFVVLGDFNIAPADIDVHDPELWKDSVLCSDKERAALKKLLYLGLVDVYRYLNEGAEYTWWDYRQAAFRRNMGLRIDLILANKGFASDFTRVVIDKLARKWKRPSDHAPVLAELK